jgi:putative polyhydroxyalkanoate system protein
MSTIDIHHPHALPADKARKAVQEVADKLDARFGMESRWEGDTLHFSRSGVDGHIALMPKELHVTAKLGFLLSAMKGPIEQEIRRVLGERFA